MSPQLLIAKQKKQLNKLLLFIIFIAIIGIILSAIYGAKYHSLQKEIDSLQHKYTIEYNKIKVLNYKLDSTSKVRIVEYNYIDSLTRKTEEYSMIILQKNLEIKYIKGRYSKYTLDSLRNEAINKVTTNNIFNQ